MQKPEEINGLEEKLEEFDRSLSMQSRLSAHSRLAGKFKLSVQSRSTRNPGLAWEGPRGSLDVCLMRKSALSTRLAWKVNYLRPIKGVGSRRKIHTKSQSYPKHDPIP